MIGLQTRMFTLYSGIRIGFFCSRNETSAHTLVSPQVAYLRCEHMQVQKLKVQSAGSQVGKKVERAKRSLAGRQKGEMYMHES
jgi:hypothetical protein